MDCPRGFGSTHMLPPSSVLGTDRSLSVREFEATSSRRRPSSAFEAADRTSRQIVRFETFGDEVFWTDQRQIHRSVAALLMPPLGETNSSAERLPAMPQLENAIELSMEALRVYTKAPPAPPYEPPK